LSHSDPTTEGSVLAADFASFLASVRDPEPTAVTVRVRGHDDRLGHRQTIETALRELVGVWDCDAAGVFGQMYGSSFVQTLVNPGKSSVYGEAVDLDAHRCGHLSADQRDRLTSLGWRDPKVEVMPYQDAEYAVEWDCNFARAWPLPEITLTEIATDFALTLRTVYGLHPLRDLDVTLIRYPDDGGSGSTSEPIAGRMPVRSDQRQVVNAPTSASGRGNPGDRRRSNEAHP